MDTSTSADRTEFPRISKEPAEQTAAKPPVFAASSLRFYGLGVHRAVLALSVATALSFFPGCGSKGPQAADSVLVAGQRLQGRWRVRSFVPEAPLEAPLQGLLSAQMGIMTLTIAGSDYRAEGTAISINGRFQILSAEGELLSLTLYDSTGVPYRMSGQFNGPVFEFRSFDAPWRGTGSIERL